MLCVHAFKQLIDENEINYHLSAQIRLEIFYFKTFNMNQMQHQQNHI